MKSYKAAVLLKQNLDLRLDIFNIANRDPLYGEVKVKVKTSGLCGAQVNEITGKKGLDRFLPHFMGHEGFGYVAAVGEGVTKVKEGDAVILHWRVGDGIGVGGIKCQSMNGLDIGGGPVTTFSEITFVSENRCTPIAPKAGYENIYPLLGCALPTAYGALVSESLVNTEDKILIFGAGGLGMALLYWCNVLGFSDVSVVDIAEGKRNQVEDLGGIFMNISELNETTKKYTALFETAGVTGNILTCFNLADKGARINLIGQVPKDDSLTLDNFLRFYDGMKLIASQGGQFEPSRDMESLVDKIHRTDNVEHALVSHVIDIDHVNEGFQLMKEPAARRVIIDFGD